MQQDVLQAQVNRTKIVKEITMHHQLMGQVQAHLKGLLNRDQGSPDIVTEELIETPLQRTSDELLADGPAEQPPDSGRCKLHSEARMRRWRPRSVRGSRTLKLVISTRTPTASIGTITCSPSMCVFLARPPEPSEPLPSYMPLPLPVSLVVVVIAAIPIAGIPAM